MVSPVWAVKERVLVSKQLPHCPLIASTDVMPKVHGQLWTVPPRALVRLNTRA